MVRGLLRFRATNSDEERGNIRNSSTGARVLRKDRPRSGHNHGGHSMNIITEALLIAINSLEYDGEQERADMLRALLVEVEDGEE